MISSILSISFYVLLLAAFNLKSVSILIFYLPTFYFISKEKVFKYYEALNSLMI